MAEQNFGVLVTTDKNRSFQQNVARFNIAVAVIGARSARLQHLRELLPALLKDPAGREERRGPYRIVARSYVIARRDLQVSAPLLPLPHPPQLRAHVLSIGMDLQRHRQQ